MVRHNQFNQFLQFVSDEEPSVTFSAVYEPFRHPRGASAHPAYRRWPRFYPNEPMSVFQRRND